MALPGTTAVSVGSQVMHMLDGDAGGPGDGRDGDALGRAVGAKERTRMARECVGNTATLFMRPVRGGLRAVLLLGVHAHCGACCPRRPRLCRRHGART